jgi:pimeloyl-ACP methyl ester carboxylesterase
MAQMMMLRDDDDRRAIYRRAVSLFVEAAQNGSGWTRHLIACRSAHLVGWIHSDPNGMFETLVVVVGGVEGWGMDWVAQGLALVARGFAVLLLDGPGQGESRLEQKLYLTEEWRSDCSRVLDDLQSSCGTRRFGLIGNSMGGNFAIQFAAHDPRISAYCNNGAVRIPLSQRSRTNFFPKMTAFCGTDDETLSDAIWNSLEITSEDCSAQIPFLVIHGEADPLTAIDDVKHILEWSSSADKQLHIFAAGDHCVYDKPADKHDLIADWFADRLLSRAFPA